MLIRALVLCCVLLSSFASAKAPAAGRHRHRPAVHRAFPPSRESLIAQNAEIDRLGLMRFQDDRDLEIAVALGELVHIPNTPYLVSSAIPSNRRYVRPWTLDFLNDMSTLYVQRFHKPLHVTSAVRTLKVQRSLRRWNRNAAPLHGDTASSHLAGLTVDLQRRGMTHEEILWVEDYLLYLGDEVIVEEELHQPCFHICVRGIYRGM